MATGDAVEVVRAWHAALNDGEPERLVAFSTPDVEVGGPRGTGRGTHLLREWFARAGVRIEPRQMFGRQQTVVVAQVATWSAPMRAAGGAEPMAAQRQAGGAESVEAPTGEGQAARPQTVASVFVVRDGLVARVVRYPDLESALQAAGLTQSDAV